MYLAPLINDLNSLWNEGVQAYDAYKEETFNLKACLLWTVNDFPAYGNLSRFSVKGYKACPIYDEGTYCQYLKNSRKLCYMVTGSFFLVIMYTEIERMLLTVPKKGIWLDNV